MEYLWKKTAGVLLLGSVLALAGCDLGDENGSTASAGSTPPPATPLAYSGVNTPATFDTSDQNNMDTAGGAAGSSSGGLINNAANGGLDSLFNVPTSVVADGQERASNATIIALFASLNLDGLKQPVATLSQNLTNPAPCAVPNTSPDSAITYYLSGAYIVVTFDSACLAILPGGGEATVNGQLVVSSLDVDSSASPPTILKASFTPKNLTIQDNAIYTTYNVPAGTYTVDNGALSILVPCHDDVCKITMPTTGPTQDTGTGAWNFAGATVYDPLLGSFDVQGVNLMLCTDGSGTADGPFSSGDLILTDQASNNLTVTFSACGTPPVTSAGT